MITVIKNVSVYSPAPLGTKDLLIADRRIAAIEEHIGVPTKLPSIRVIDGKGAIIIPGLIDSHVHIMGGGGEGGFATRTSQIMLSQATTAGVTTLIGVRGTDGISRSMEGFVAKARGLKEEGISCWVLTGSYQVPVKTITERIESDIMMISEVIGVGEIAISDHRSSQPTFEEIAKIAAAARVGGMLSGKAGVVNVHLGDGPRGLALIQRVVNETEIPCRQFVPTHMNRNPDLFASGIEYARQGGYLDFTTSTAKKFLDEGEVKCSRALKRCLEGGVSPDHITFSSDGQGSLPVFNADNEYTGLMVGTCASLFPEVRDAIVKEKIPMETALKVVTENPSRIYKLAGKGRIQVGGDADLIFLSPGDLSILRVMALGKVMVEEGKAVVKGTFEKDL